MQAVATSLRSRGACHPLIALTLPRPSRRHAQLGAATADRLGEVRAESLREVEKIRREKDREKAADPRLPILLGCNSIPTGICATEQAVGQARATEEQG